MGAGGGKRVHVHIPLCHKRLGSAVPARGQGILGCRGDFRSLDKRTAGNTRNRALGMVLGQTLQGRPKDTRPAVRHTELPGPGTVPVRRKCHVGERPLDGALRNSNRRADLLPRRTDGRGYRTPAKATGAALGVVGIASYIAAGIQDVASGWLIDSHITVATDGAKHYDFGPVALFWIAASVISFLLPLMNRKQKTEA